MSLQELAGLSIVPTRVVGASVTIDSVGVGTEVGSCDVELIVVNVWGGAEVGDCEAVSEMMC